MRAPVTPAFAAAVLCFACATQQKPLPDSAQRQSMDKERAATAAKATAGDRDKASKAQGADKGPPELAQYRAIMTRELIRLTHSREVTGAGGDDSGGGAIPHSILVLKRIGQSDAYVVVTIGYGRTAHSKRAPSNVELIAYVEQYGPNVGKVLSALGELMWARGQDATPWHEYDVVMLPKAEQGLQYFDLRPGGQVDVSSDLTVTLLKVVPMSEEEYEVALKNPSNEFDDPNANARATYRWRQIVERK
jgi:hypothetical protein